eukprot:TRINITY_DN855_c0_g1_i3.p1 TRINITY_DN855_c0_g1~~TRINITY_DN855_c0_g1_i3.p1  ORF type:complete len:2229 (+),score=471.93 TRINITY_DN855_c0_g1_i3:81-6689(+)
MPVRAVSGRGAHGAVLATPPPASQLRGARTTGAAARQQDAASRGASSRQSPARPSRDPSRVSPHHTRARVHSTAAGGTPAELRRSEGDPRTPGGAGSAARRSASAQRQRRAGAGPPSAAAASALRSSTAAPQKEPQRKGDRHHHASHGPQQGSPRPTSESAGRDQGGARRRNSLNPEGHTPQRHAAGPRSDGAAQQRATAGRAAGASPAARRQAAADAGGSAAAPSSGAPPAAGAAPQRRTGLSPLSHQRATPGAGGTYARVDTSGGATATRHLASVSPHAHRQQRSHGAAGTGAPPPVATSGGAPPSLRQQQPRPLSSAPGGDGELSARARSTQPPGTRALAQQAPPPGRDKVPPPPQRALSPAAAALSKVQALRLPTGSIGSSSASAQGGQTTTPRQIGEVSSSLTALKDIHGSQGADSRGHGQQLPGAVRGGAPQHAAAPAGAPTCNGGRSAPAATAADPAPLPIAWFRSPPPSEPADAARAEAPTPPAPEADRPLQDLANPAALAQAEQIVERLSRLPELLPLLAAGERLARLRRHRADSAARGDAAAAAAAATAIEAVAAAAQCCDGRPAQELVDLLRSLQRSATSFRNCTRQVSIALIRKTAGSGGRVTVSHLLAEQVLDAAAPPQARSQVSALLGEAFRLRVPLQLLAARAGGGAELDATLLAALCDSSDSCRGEPQPAVGVVGPPGAACYAANQLYCTYFHPELVDTGVAGSPGGEQLASLLVLVIPLAGQENGPSAAESAAALAAAAVCSSLHVTADGDARQAAAAAALVADAVAESRRGGVSAVQCVQWAPSHSIAEEPPGVLRQALAARGLGELWRPADAPPAAPPHAGGARALEQFRAAAAALSAAPRPAAPAGSAAAPMLAHRALARWGSVLAARQAARVLAGLEWRFFGEMLLRSAVPQMLKQHAEQFHHCALLALRSAAGQLPAARAAAVVADLQQTWEPLAQQAAAGAARDMLEAARRALPASDAAAEAFAADSRAGAACAVGCVLRCGAAAAACRAAVLDGPFCAAAAAWASALCAREDDSSCQAAAAAAWDAEIGRTELLLRHLLPSYKGAGEGQQSGGSSRFTAGRCLAEVRAVRAARARQDVLESATPGAAPVDEVAVVVAAAAKGLPSAELREGAVQRFAAVPWAEVASAAGLTPAAAAAGLIRAAQQHALPCRDAAAALAEHVALWDGGEWVQFAAHLGTLCGPDRRPAGSQGEAPAGVVARAMAEAAAGRGGLPEPAEVIKVLRTGLQPHNPGDEVRRGGEERARKEEGRIAGEAARDAGLLMALTAPQGCEEAVRADPGGVCGALRMLAAAEEALGGGEGGDPGPSSGGWWATAAENGVGLRAGDAARHASLWELLHLSDTGRLPPSEVPAALLGAPRGPPAEAAAGRPPPSPRAAAGRFGRSWFQRVVFTVTVPREARVARVLLEHWPPLGVHATGASVPAELQCIKEHGPGPLPRWSVEGVAAVGAFSAALAVPLRPGDACPGGEAGDAVVLGPGGVYRLQVAAWGCGEFRLSLEAADAAGRVLQLAADALAPEPPQRCATAVAVLPGPPPHPWEEDGMGDDPADLRRRLGPLRLRHWAALPQLQLRVPRAAHPAVIAVRCPEGDAEVAVLRPAVPSDGLRRAGAVAAWCDGGAAARYVGAAATDGAAGRPGVATVPLRRSAAALDDGADHPAASVYTVVVHGSGGTVEVAVATDGDGSGECELSPLPQTSEAARTAPVATVRGRWRCSPSWPVPARDAERQQGERQAMVSVLCRRSAEVTVAARCPGCVAGWELSAPGGGPPIACCEGPRPPGTDAAAVLRLPVGIYALRPTVSCAAQSWADLQYEVRVAGGQCDLAVAGGPDDCCWVIPGEWRGASAGGPPGASTFPLNPQCYIPAPAAPCRVELALCRRGVGDSGIAVQRSGSCRSTTFGRSHTYSNDAPPQQGRKARSLSLGDGTGTRVRGGGHGRSEAPALTVHAAAGAKDGMPLRDPALLRRRVVAASDPSSAGSHQLCELTFDAEPGVDAMVVPSLPSQREQGAFLLRVRTSAPLPAPPVLAADWPRQLRQEGEWKRDADGGVPDQQYLVTVERGCRAVLLLAAVDLGGLRLKVVIPPHDALFGRRLSAAAAGQARVVAEDDSGAEGSGGARQCVAELPDSLPTSPWDSNLDSNTQYLNYVALCSTVRAAQEGHSLLSLISDRPANLQQLRALDTCPPE